MYLFLFFFTASVLGYCAEVCFCTLQNHKLTWQRGFLIGPYIPIYGVGTVVVLYALRRYFNDPLALFLMSTIVCTVIEYFTSWIMEKIFKVRWWDYSHKLFNIDGRVCLINSILFGLAGLVVVYLVYPIVNNILTAIPPKHIVLISTICLIVFISDFAVTVTTLLGVRKTLVKFKQKDITEIARQEVINKIKKHSFLYNRLLKAFPHNDKFNGVEFGEFKNLVKGFREKLRQAKMNFEEKAEELKNKKTN